MTIQGRIWPTSPAVFYEIRDSCNQSPALFTRSAPANFFLFSKIKLQMKGQFFKNALNIQRTVAMELEAISVADCPHNFDPLYDHFIYIAGGGNYVEN